MAISSFLVLSLAVLAQARPRHAFEPEDVGDRITLPVISARGVDVKGDLSQRSAADEEDKPFHILPFPYPSKRDIESREEEDKPWHILPFPYPSKRDVESREEEDKPWHILPFTGPSKRKILEDDDGADGRITLPVPQRARRSEDEEDKPFHILPFNDKRKLPVEDVPSGTITLPIIHRHRSFLDKRAVEVQVENRSDVSYYAQLNIGTPPQTVYAQIDTGSFELWVNPDCSNVQTGDQRFCRAIGVYDPKSSSTSFVTGSAAQLRYGIGSANVSYVQDSISLPGSATMKQVQFGVALSSVDEFSGILGIGAGDGFNTLYPNFIDELASQGITKTKAFSLALGSKAEEEGVIIFGGVDTGKFTGKLANLPIVPADDSPDGVARYWVGMNSISLSPPNGKSTTFAQTKMTVFLDSGSTLTLLPQSLVNEIADGLGSTGTDDSGFAIVDCDLANQPGTIDFAFDGVTIKVPYSEMIRSVNSLPPHCYLGMMGSTQFALLGDTFLRSAYAVFDLTGNMIHLAQYVNCGTNVKSITSTSSLLGLAGSCNSNGSESPSSPSSSSSPLSSPSKTASKAAPSTTAPSSSTVQPPSSAQSTAASPSAARSSDAASTTAANTAKSSATGGADAESAQSGDKNGAGKMGVHGLAISMVFAAMGLLLI